MKTQFLAILSLERYLADGSIETLLFEAGVNVFVGAPNTGKTKWLQTLDYLLGDSGGHTFEGATEDGLADKYVGASTTATVAGNTVKIERRWKEPGSKTKVFVDNKSYTTSEFQDWLMQELQIPILHFPKGNPMSGQTWPELSFRMMLRHIYRQQRFWGDLADQQPEAEQLACILQFLGIAESLFTDDYGTLIGLRIEIEQTKNRREQYNSTLSEIAKDVISEPGLSVTVTEGSAKRATQLLIAEVETLRAQRVALLEGARESIIPVSERSRISQIAERRSRLLVELESLRTKFDESRLRSSELNNYQQDLTNELERLLRAEDAGMILADLKITHCPACDQPVSDEATDAEHCFLCHQIVLSDPLAEQLGSTRLHFERERLSGELKESNGLLKVVEEESAALLRRINVTEENFAKIESELAPARQIIGAFAQDSISAIDNRIGELGERQRQIGRVLTALELGKTLTEKILLLEAKILPVRERVDTLVRSIDFNAAASQLEEGMNDYLNAINVLRPGSWRHNAIRIAISRSKFDISVGTRRWRSALGGTDTLYFLMAYNYGLLSLSSKSGKHYPGLSVIDVPGEFSGESIEDKENFIIQPFIELLKAPEYAGAQMIVTGASFKGLKDANRITLTDIHVA